MLGLLPLIPHVVFADTYHSVFDQWCDGVKFYLRLHPWILRSR